MRLLPLRLFASFAGLCAAAAAQIPFHFEPAPAGAFVARQPGLQIRVDGTGAEVALPEGRRLAVRLAGGTAGASAERPLPGRSHYLIGNDPADWRHDVPHSAQVRCASAWPGIDVVWYGRDGALEYDLVIAPGARAELAAITFAGADGIALRSDGSVVLTLGENELVQRPPYAFQVVGGERREVRIDVQLERDTVTFRPISHDATRELVIDPQIAYGSYLGGTGADAVHAIALDATGNVYLTGLTTSANFPVVSPAQPAIAGLYDVFVTKLDPTGTTILWSTFVGGNSSGFGIDEWPVALAVGPGGEVVVLGRTESTNFPTVNAVQPALAGNVDAFVFALAPSGSQLLWSTYLGGSGFEIDGDVQIGAGGGGVVIDAAGNAFVAGMTRSPDFPTANAVHPSPLGNSDLFIARFDAAGQRLYASYFGGSGFDDLAAANPSEPGRALLCGTSSGGFPTTPGVYDGSGDGGFVANVDVQAQSLVWSTAFPAGIADAALDPAGNVYVVGTTSLGSGPLPTTMGAHQPDHGGSIQSHPWQAFAAKLTAGASSLAWCTYWGTPTDNESFSDVAVDAFGHACAFGTTTEHFSTPSQSSLLVKFNTEGSSVVYSLEVAGRNSTGRDVTVAATGAVWVAGETWATGGFATSGALQTVHGGNRDGFVARITDAASSLRGFELPVDRLTSSDVRIGTVTLDGAAPAGGAFVTLTSSSPDVAVPAAVFVPAGSATALVPVTSSRVQGTQLATFTATWNGTVKMTKARLWPGPWFRAVTAAVPNGASVEGYDLDAFGTVVGTTGNAPFRFHESTGMQTITAGGEARGIADDGAIAGGNGAQAFRWTPAGGMQLLGALQPGMFSIGYDADEAGRVVGFSDFTSGGFTGRRAFLWSQGTGMQNLGTLGGNASVAYAQNRTGAVTGSASLASQHEHPFLWRPAGMQDLGVLPGFDHGTGNDVNDADQVAGVMLTGSTLRAFLWTPGIGLRDLGVLTGDTSSGALGINSHGWTVGWSSPGQANGGTAMWHRNGAMQALHDELSAEDAFAWDLVAAHAINDAGQIAGTGLLRGQVGTSAFRLDPVLVRPYGRGCAGADHRVTALAGTGHPAAGNSVTLHLSGRPLAPALLVLGSGPGMAPLPGGCEVHVAGPFVSIVVLLDAAGTAAVPLPLPASLQPQSFFLQAATIDPAAANGFLTTSNGLELRVL